VNIPGYTIIGPLAYRGKKGCMSVTCTRSFRDGEMNEDCFGWHCSYCDEPCSSQGHRCDAADAILGEAARPSVSPAAQEDA
jgi:hypothetical protein